MKNNNNLNSNLQDLLIFKEAAYIYNDPLNERNQMLKDLKSKAGVYCRFNNLNCKFYIGSAVNLNNRINDYYQDNYYKDKKKSYYC